MSRTYRRSKKNGYWKSTELSRKEARNVDYVHNFWMCDTNIFNDDSVVYRDRGVGWYPYSKPLKEGSNSRMRARTRQLIHLTLININLEIDYVFPIVREADDVWHYD